MMRHLTPLLLSFAVLRLHADDLVPGVRYKLSAGDLLSANAIVDEYHRSHPDDSSYAAAVAWLARGALMLHQNEAASRYVTQAKAVTAELLKTRNVENDTELANAVGAAIEVEAHLLVARGERERALALLQQELSNWKVFSIQARVQKNINLLTLEGSPAPAIFPETKNKPVLLFLWAHWCSDCKAEASVIARLKDKYEARGLLVIAPTRRYGAVPNSDNPSVEQEDREIETVWKNSYPGLSNVSHPISDQAMRAFGVSSTPTLVLIDSSGIVRMYRPFRMSDADLEIQIEALLQPSRSKE